MANVEAEAAKARGNTFFKNQQYEQAVAEFSKAIQIDPKNHVYYSNRSACFAEMKKWKEALEDGEACVKANPRFAKGYSRKGLALFNMGKYKEAKDVYTEGLNVEPNNEQLKEGLEECNGRMKDPLGLKSKFDNMWGVLATNPKFAQKLKDPKFLQKMKLLQANPQMALQAQDPEMIEAFFLIMGIQMPPEAASGAGIHDDMPPPPQSFHTSSSSDQNVTVEEEEEEEAPKASSHSSSSSSARAEAEKEATKPEVTQDNANAKRAIALKEEGNELYKMHKLHEAFDKYNQAVELDPENPTLYLNRAAVHLEKNNFEECHKDCNTSLELASKKPTHVYDTFAKAYARIGAAYYKENKIPEAIQAYEKSLLESNNPAIRKKLIEVERKKKELEEKAYLDPEKASEANKRGNACFTDGKWVDAISEYSESIRRNPDDAKVYANRAACYMKVMDWEKALADIDSCLKIDPKYVKAYIRRGKIQHMLKQYHKALESFEEGLKLDPECSDLHESIVQTRIAIQKDMNSGDTQERAKKAMEDPEIRNIMSDLSMQKVLEDISSGNAAASQAAMMDSQIRSKIEKLVAAGIIQMGRRPSPQ